MADIITKLSDIPIVLASGSPRRIQMLRDLGTDPKIIKPDCNEELHIGLTPAQTVMALALRKAMCVEKMPECAELEDYLLISCDTVVSFEGEILGKPVSEYDAFAMLDKMSGKMNSVYSGVCLKRKNGRRLLFYDCSNVYFKPYGKQEIIAYVATGEPMDKAGAYAIQGGFSGYCEKVDGSVNNVIGLPTERIISILAKGF